MCRALVMTSRAGAGSGHAPDSFDFRQVMAKGLAFAMGVVLLLVAAGTAVAGKCILHVGLGDR
jgi:hypothetical protein